MEVMTEILGGCTNIGRVGGCPENHSGKREDMYILRKLCGSAVEGERERFAINGDCMILCSC